jgi:gliding motility-associated-like protein
LPSGLAAVTGASSDNCSGGFATDSIVLTLNQALPAGDHQVNVKIGSDGNSLLDNCDNNIPDGSIAVTVHQNVSAQFAYVLKEGCIRDTLELTHDGANSTNTWNWEFDGGTAATQNTSVIYLEGGDKNVTLTVANDFCTDVYSTTVSVPARLDASFASPEITCAVDDVVIIEKSAGNVQTWNWDFGNGTTSSVKDPDPFKYMAQPGEKNYVIRLTVSNALGCIDTASANIIVVGNCNIVVPTAFSPNNDGKNDYLFPTNAFGADNLVFRVYNRFGQLVFETKDWQRKWDGNVNGQPQSTGTYVWSLSYTLRSTGRRYFFKGTAVLVR